MVTDKQLIENYQSGDEISFNILFKRYKPILDLFAYKMVSTFQKYDESKDYLHHFSELSFKFLEAVNKCIISRMKDESFKKRLHYYLRHYRQCQHSYYNSKGRRHVKQTKISSKSEKEVFYSVEVESNNGSNYYSIDEIGCYDKNIARVEHRMMIDSILIEAKNVLSKKEYKVLKSHFDGCTNKEIAKSLKCTLSYITMIKKKIKRKMQVEL